MLYLYIYGSVSTMTVPLFLQNKWLEGSTQTPTQGHKSENRGNGILCLLLLRPFDRI